MLSRTAQNLAAKYSGVFSPQTVERYVFESYAGAAPKDVPEVLFICVHNAGRSQMAAALLNHHGQGRIHVRSAGSAPSDWARAVSRSAAKRVARAVRWLWMRAVRRRARRRRSTRR